MQVKISKTLEGIIARAAFNTTKAGIDHSLKDFLMLEMLREEGSLAYQLLSSRLKDWELYQVRLRIEREVLGAGRRENTGAEEFYRAFTDELCAVSGAVRSVSTAHALRAIVGDRSTATSRVLEMYGITGEVVSEDIKKFAAGDDFPHGDTGTHARFQRGKQTRREKHIARARQVRRKSHADGPRG